MKPQYVAGAFLIITLSVISTCSYISHLKAQIGTSQAALIQKDLEAEGFKKALLAKPTEVIKLVPTLVTKYVEVGVHEGTIQPIASGHVEGKTNLFVPCPMSSGDTANTPIENQGTDVHLSVYGNFLITRIRFGEAVSWKGDLGGSAAFGEGQPKPLVFTPEDTKFNIVVSSDIERALLAHEREGGFWKRHTAFACPTVTATYNPLDTTRPINVGIGCGWGMVWR